ncbi:hypothetical protein DID88_007420 [Monilinia fructigena]|uniref:Uncharacterized protein n=1 Tax=Monilinia fructigena TaxID=38457 RepID=A0A395J8A4_9HELO|nr:hypothetical protein DID88_007420 [Monilinia fructigena]
MASPGEDVYATLLLTDTYLPVLVTTDSVTSESLAELERNFDYVIPVDRVVNQSPANLDLMVYMDADMVALRAPDELFALPDAFSAAPDIGWPDIFNTGLMVLNPNLGDYYALEAMAHRGISFDGADQGLLNMHFKNTFNRLSFTYNVTPSAHYQYLPAFHHFQSSISAAHFIGTDKPWKVGRQASFMIKHYKQTSGSGNNNGGAPLIVQYLVFGEFQPKTQEDQSQGAQLQAKLDQISEPGSLIFTMGCQQHHRRKILDQKPRISPEPIMRCPTMLLHSKPQTVTPILPTICTTKYQKTPKYQRPPPIFPWEANPPKPSRVFPEDDYDDTVVPEAPEVPETPVAGSVVATTEDERSMPPTPDNSNHSASADPWQTYARANAWDEVPEIERYIGNMTKSRKGNIQVVQGYGSELERPSLPVTPAPIRSQPSFWGEEKDGEGALPPAEGVPAQQDWDPAAQLDMLARRQSDVLASKLDLPTRDMPSRPLPYGSEPVNPGSGGAIEEPSYHGPGAAWEKNENYATKETPLLPSEEEKDILET